MKAPTSSSAATTSSGGAIAADPGPESELRPLLLTRRTPSSARTMKRSGAFLVGFYRKGLTDTGDPLYGHRLRFANYVAAPLARRRRARRGCAERGDPAERLEARLPPWFGEMTPLGKVQYLEIATFLEERLLHTQGGRMLMQGLDRGPLPLRLPGGRNRPRAFRTGFGCGACRRSTCCGGLSSTGCRRRSRPESAPTARRSSAAPSSAGCPSCASCWTSAASTSRAARPGRGRAPRSQVRGRRAARRGERGGRDDPRRRALRRSSCATASWRRLEAWPSRSSRSRRDRGRPVLAPRRAENDRVNVRLLHETLRLAWPSRWSARR